MEIVRIYSYTNLAKEKLKKNTESVLYNMFDRTDRSYYKDLAHCEYLIIDIFILKFDQNFLCLKRVKMCQS